MAKETRKQIEERHAKEMRQFQKDCKHRHLIVLESSISTCGMESPLRDLSVWKAISEHKTMPKNECELAGYENIHVKCKDCGTPILTIDHHGLSIYIQPHYASKGIVLPPDPFENKP